MVLTQLLVFYVFENKIPEFRHLCSSEVKGGRLKFLRAAHSFHTKLSKSLHVQMNGRLLLLLASCLPYCDKSGLNAKGEIKTDNVTVIEDVLPEDMDIDSSNRGL